VYGGGLELVDMKTGWGKDVHPWGRQASAEDPTFLQRYS
jgi:hypothetical protein